MRYLLVAFLLVISGVAFSQEFSPLVRVNTDTTDADRMPVMHVGPNGSIYVGWVKVSDAGGDAYFSRSDDGGRTFTPAVKATVGAEIPADLGRGAPFSIDTKGNIHAVWVENRLESPAHKLQSDVFYIRSTDNGETWSTEVVLSDDSLTYLQDFPSLACDSSGNVYLSFLDSRERSQGQSQNPQLYLRKSTDNGMTWTPVRKVNKMPNGIGGTCECCKQDIQAGKNGVVTIAFRSNINTTGIPGDDRRDIFSIRSTDYGETFSEAVPVQAERWTIDACPTSGPNTFITEDGTMYAAWRDARDAAGGMSHVYFSSQFANEPLDFNSRVDLNGEILPNWPDVAVRNGVVAVVYETNNQGLQYYVTSPDDISIKSGVHFNEDRQQFGSIEFGPNGERYLLWQENRSGTDDIYFAIDTMPLSSGAVAEIRQPLFHIAPNPVRPTDDLKITLTEDASYDEYQLIDIAGRVVARGTLHPEGSSVSITIPEVPSGSYILRLQSDATTASQMVMIKD